MSREKREGTDLRAHCDSLLTKLDQDQYPRMHKLTTFMLRCAQDADDDKTEAQEVVLYVLRFVPQQLPFPDADTYYVLRRTFVQRAMELCRNEHPGLMAAAHRAWGINVPRRYLPTGAVGASPVQPRQRLEYSGDDTEPDTDSD